MGGVCEISAIAHSYTAWTTPYGVREETSTQGRLKGSNSSTSRTPYPTHTISTLGSIHVIFTA